MTMRDDTVVLSWKSGQQVELGLMATPRTSTESPRVEVVEENDSYRWQRWHFPDPQWPRIIEVRADVLGTVNLIAHLQRNLAGDGRAPDFGWELTGLGLPVGDAGKDRGMKSAGHPGSDHGAADRIDTELRRDGRGRSLSSEFVAAASQARCIAGDSLSFSGERSQTTPLPGRCTLITLAPIFATESSGTYAWK
jgi:hypothetical protein